MVPISLSPTQRLDIARHALLNPEKNRFLAFPAGFEPVLPP
jgi:hypothetical protein